MTAPSLRILYKKLDLETAHSVSSVETRTGLARRRALRQQQLEAGRALAVQALAEMALDTSHTLLRVGERWTIEGPSPCWLSVSHSGPWVVCALSQQGPIGIDIEAHNRPLRELKSWSDHLDDQLYSALEALDEDLGPPMLIACWTLLEALGKLRQTPLLQSVRYPLVNETGALVLADWSATHRCYGRALADTHLLSIVAPTLAEEEQTQLALQALRTLDDLRALLEG